MRMGEHEDQIVENVDIQGICILPAGQIAAARLDTFELPFCLLFAQNTSDLQVVERAFVPKFLDNCRTQSPLGEEGR